MSAGIVDIQRQLIKKAKLGDTKAFSQLYAEIYKDLYRFALYMTKHTQDAEDAVSEAVISAYENISGLKKENSFKSWMFTILNNECKKILRKNGNTSNQVSEEDAKNLGAEEIDFAQRHDVTGSRSRASSGCARRSSRRCATSPTPSTRKAPPLRSRSVTAAT